jgi:aminopeptidase N
MRPRSLAVLLLGTALSAQAPNGIPRDLARLRAQQLTDVRYQLSYIIRPQAATLEGHEELRFVQNADDRGILSEWLDFREGTVRSLKINGKATEPNIQNGHVELPAKLLKLGENEVEIDFAAPVAPAGKAITRFEDKDDGSEYIYTLFVPMDAEMAFPCFDQPDLKAKFKLSVQHPTGWTVISNTFQDSNESMGSISKTSFAETKPISTYLFAFAAGPFKKVHDVAGLPGLYVRQSKLKRAQEEAEAVQQITAQGMKYLADYFAQPFPFPKYDLVMIPGFAYGGMEHAGATFVREESILFRTAPTHSDRFNRDVLLLHELTHQWFGDLVTMRWFDDLWLKEGFANYMAYRALADLKPSDNVWKRFYQAMKPAAYGIDSTQGTTPIYQDIPNLKDAKSAYGAIVYSKAPAVMKQLAYVIGESQFRSGLRLYLKEHAFANAEWSDLVGAFERVSGKHLQSWADAYIKHRGMPQVDVVQFSCDSQHNLQSLILKQHDALGEGGIWPISTQVRLGYFTGPAFTFRARLNGDQADVGKEAAGKHCPDYVFANDQDYAYGRFLLDPRSQKAVIQQLGGISDVFERTLLWGSLWDSVREAQLNPRDYIDLALRLLPAEKDEALARSIIGRTATALHRYVPPELRNELAPKAEALAYDRMLNSPDTDMRITWFRGLRGFAQTEKGLSPLKDLLRGKLKVPGVELRQLDRWSMVASLVALHDPEANTILEEEKARDPSGEGRKYAYMAAAAQPDPGTKKHYFDDYLHNAALPEDWVDQSLDTFNYWNQAELTEPYLRPALDALPQVKSQRKIFFLLAWLNAFIGGQQSPEAQAEVHSFLNSATLDRDLRLKILEVSDELDRTVRIRKSFSGNTAATSGGR